jgi:hypothetical protein
MLSLVGAKYAWLAGTLGLLLSADQAVVHAKGRDCGCCLSVRHEAAGQGSGRKLVDGPRDVFRVPFA